MKVCIWGPLGFENGVFAFDPGATVTLVDPGILDSLGYSPRTGETISSITSAVSMELGYLRRVQTFAALGFEHEDFLVNASDLPERAGIDGLLGLNFLHQYNYEVRSKEGLIRIEPT